MFYKIISLCLNSLALQWKLESLGKHYFRMHLSAEENIICLNKIDYIFLCNLEFINFY